MSSTLWLIIGCGILSIVYAIWATKSVLAADAGNARMQEIAGAIQEGAKASGVIKASSVMIGVDD